MKILQSMIFALIERSETELAEPIIRLLPVAIGLIYLGKTGKFCCSKFPILTFSILLSKPIIYWAKGLKAWWQRSLAGELPPRVRSLGAAPGCLLFLPISQGEHW
jgi:hypothetical protein